MPPQHTTIENIVLERVRMGLQFTDLYCLTFYLQMDISMASSSEDSVSTSVYLTILKGLERLLLTDVLQPSDGEIIVKLSVDRYDTGPQIFDLCSLFFTSFRHADAVRGICSR